MQDILTEIGTAKKIRQNTLFTVYGMSQLKLQKTVKKLCDLGYITEPIDCINIDFKETKHIISDVIDYLVTEYPKEMRLLTTESNKIDVDYWNIEFVKHFVDDDIFIKSIQVLYDFNQEIKQLKYSKELLESIKPKKDFIKQVVNFRYGSGSKTENAVTYTRPLFPELFFSGKLNEEVEVVNIGRSMIHALMIYLGKSEAQYYAYLRQGKPFFTKVFTQKEEELFIYEVLQRKVKLNGTFGKLLNNKIQEYYAESLKRYNVKMLNFPSFLKSNYQRMLEYIYIDYPLLRNHKGRPVLFQNFNIYFIKDNDM